MSNPPDPQGQEEKRRLARLGNVELDISVELGRTEATYRQLAELKVEDVIELPKLAGEAFDIFLNGRRFAEGEVVVVTDLMAVRVTGLIDCEGDK